ncbi:MAG: sorbosone dehydrogenase family protein [Oscillatoriales cyanobacterium]|uniref:Sorbosone dehydrogenase family protein n=1 Tax=Microcoleus anatoxicus PTRS2 TaxID=2705321 RepID=A0ABU8YMC8_9CYAN|nr:MAG: sorbosone dehydrogenase family protein [Oscillatoriales cyanobacterium]TAD95404.1 MAG: sorbosone dehydrogenase family protein [Oscillatoriales cyanobacterium]TAE03039.1 MAG: sorbosone dehydrogenase family protein [Oscillatoriales cyanobacterium]TAF02832.1 MAG: sorbosone dehydrogenase family protein [Oscillatoriales cyanobacterium]TAF37019.1 MAG: sorbosone dehydrogenase family protein [Oscillatoriales cyanobacterium]
MYNLRFLLLILLLPVVACSPATDAQAPRILATSPLSQIPSQANTNSATSQSIPTKALSPQPIRISPGNLPQPFATDSASKPPQVIPPPPSPVLRVPAGFVVNVFAENLDAPRWLALTPTGDVLVTETRQNRITLLRDTNGDGVAEVKQTFAQAENGLNIPFGMAFGQGYFFLGNTAEVRRFPYTTGQHKLTGIGQKIADLPGGGYNQHWTRNVVMSPDGKKLYVSVGSQSNADTEPLPRASVQVMNLDGKNQQTFASGLRNPVGLDFHPSSGQLYATVNERDGLGDDLVPDYLTRIRQDQFYGWPFAYFKPNLLDPRHVKNGRSERPDLVAKTLTPDVLFQAHSAALGLQFYDGKTFPKKYRNGAFVAFRGSWNRNAGTGYKIVFVPFNANFRPEGYYEDFLTGFLTEPSVPKTWGRPVGLLVLPDGSLLFTEEANNRIYRIQYRG